MKVFALYRVLCDYTCGCIIVAAKNKKEVVEIIKEKRHGLGLDSDGDVTWENIEDKLEEITAGYYEEVWGGG